MGRILIIDDMPGSREAMARLLQQKGYETVCAGNGEEGILKMRKSQPDLVLLDHMMPKVDGLTFLAQIRRFPRWKEVPVIMYTGIRDRAHHMKAAALGVSEYLVKADFKAPELVGHVQRLVPVN
jgi:CheY-like chemotaxis protein